MYFADRLSATFCARDSIQMKAPLRPGLCFIPYASAGTEPGDKCGVGRLAMTAARPSWQVPAAGSSPGGRGAYAVVLLGVPGQGARRCGLSLSSRRYLAAGPKTHCCGSGREVASNRAAHHPKVEHNADEAELVQNVDAVSSNSLACCSAVMPMQC
jgi:hypothetical protein